MALVECQSGTRDPYENKKLNCSWSMLGVLEVPAGAEVFYRRHERPFRPYGICSVHLMINGHSDYEHWDNDIY